MLHKTEDRHLLQERQNRTERHVKEKGRKGCTKVQRPEEVSVRKSSGGTIQTKAKRLRKGGQKGGGGKRETGQDATHPTQKRPWECVECAMRRGFRRLQHRQTPKRKRGGHLNGTVFERDPEAGNGRKSLL